MENGKEQSPAQTYIIILLK